MCGGFDIFAFGITLGYVLGMFVLGIFAFGITLGFVLGMCVLGINGAFGITLGFDLGMAPGIVFAFGITLGIVLGIAPGIIKRLLKKNCGQIPCNRVFMSGECSRERFYTEFHGTFHTQSQG